MGKRSAVMASEASPTTAQDRAAAERRAKLLEFFADPPAEVLAAAEAVGRARAHYGDDAEREMTDLAAGRHLLQRRGVKTTPR